MALLHLESTLSQDDREAFEEARKTGGTWGGPVEKTNLFLYWLSFHQVSSTAANYTKRLAKAMPEIPQTIAAKQRETNPIYAITSKESAS